MEVTLNTTIKELFENNLISVRAYNCLRWPKRTVRDGFCYREEPFFQTVEDLMASSYNSLMAIRNMGRQTLDALAETLKSYGFELPGYSEVLAERRDERIGKTILDDSKSYAMSKGVNNFEGYWEIVRKAIYTKFGVAKQNDLRISEAKDITKFGKSFIDSTYVLFQ